MDFIFNFIGNHPDFFLGLGIGLFGCILLWRDGMSKRASMRREVKKLRRELEDQSDHIGRHLKINQKGVATFEEQIGQLKEENNNLKDTLAVYKQKPSAEERRMIQVYDRSVRKLNEKVPGFAPAWESAFREADEEVDKAEKGLGRLTRKVVAPPMPVSSDPSRSALALPENSR
ncbi:MAG: hypothetical protein ACFB21_16475 [Opitutales bacterium]